MLARLGLSRDAAAQAEEVFLPGQVDHDRDVDQQDADAYRGLTAEHFRDLQRNADATRDDGEVLGPAPPTRQPYRFRELQQPEEQRADPDEQHGPRGILANAA